MRDDRCPSCGAKVGWSSAACPSCGSALDLPVEAVRGPGPEGDDVELGRPATRWWPAMAVVAAVALLAVGAVVAGDRSPRRAATTTVPTTVTTVTDAATTAAPTSTDPVPTTARVPERRTLPGAPFLSLTSTRGAVLYGVNLSRAEVWRIDLDTGDATVRPVRPVGTGSGALLLARSGGVVLAAVGSPVVFLPDDPDEPERVLGVGTVWPLPHADPDLVWIVSLGPQYTARLVDMDGNRLSDAFPVEERVVGDDGSGRLLVWVGDGFYALDGGGATRVAAYPLVAWDASRTVTVECAPDALRCDLVARARPSGDEVGRAPASSAMARSVFAGSRLSPQGGAVASIGFGTSGPRLEIDHFDGRDRRAYAFLVFSSFSPVGAGETPLWWIDETLVCGLEEPGTIRCWSDGDEQATFLVNPDGVPPFVTAAVAVPATTPPPA